MDQAIQMVGALLVLAAFVLAQLHRLATDSATYLSLNVVGTGILAVVAGVNGDLHGAIVQAIRP